MQKPVNDLSIGIWANKVKVCSAKFQAKSPDKEEFLLVFPSLYSQPNIQWHLNAGRHNFHPEI
jgi:hypothetical protein